MGTHVFRLGSMPAQHLYSAGSRTVQQLRIFLCLGAFSNKVLASLFNVPVSYFDKLPKYQTDLFVVSGSG